MRGSIAAVLASGTCAIGFLAGWLVFRSGGACKIDLPPTQPLQRAEAPAISDRAPDLEKLDSPPAVAPSESALQSVPRTPSREVATAPPAIADLLSMPESTRSALDAKANAIREALPVYTHPAFESEIAAGNIRPDLWDESDTSKTLHEEADVTLCSRDDTHGFFHVVLPRSGYPDIYELHDCLNRLRGRIRELEHGDFMTKRQAENAKLRK